MRPLRLNDNVGLAAMEAMLQAADVIRLPLPPAVYERACHIRAVYNFKLGDALHLAAAVESGCDRVLTNDYRLSKFTDITVEILP